MEFECLTTEAENLTTVFAAETGIAREKIRTVASPYRICPLGAHIDHQGGPVLGMTINAYTILAYVPTEDGTISLRSLNYPGNVAFHLDRIPENTGSFWGTYARGAVLALKEAHPLKRGIIGSRFSGGGFGGCVVGFVKASKAQEAARNIRINYQKRHPEAADQAAVYLAKPEDGIRFL